MENFLIDERPLRPKDWAFDVAVAAVAYGFGCIQMVLAASSLVMPDETLRRLLGIEAIVPTTAAFVALALTVFPLVLRRRFPWPVFLFTLVTFLGLQSSFRGYSLTIVGPLIALFTIASERSRTETVVAGLVALAGLLLAVGPTQSATMAFLTRFQNVALMAAGALGGYAFRTHREYVRAMEQRALEAERTREEVAARRVEEERVRIAREVHDITAHSLSAVSIQAAAAERLIDRDPQAAKEAIATARTTAKDALEEIRGMIGVLRAKDGAPETEPTKGTDRLEDLAAYLQEAGVEARIDEAGYDRLRVPTYVDVALYDIAREATTNIVRHAQARTAAIRIAGEEGLRAADGGRRRRRRGERAGGSRACRARHRGHGGAGASAGRHAGGRAAVRRRFPRDGRAAGAGKGRGAMTGRAIGGGPATDEAVREDGLRVLGGRRPGRGAQRVQAHPLVLRRAGRGRRGAQRGRSRGGSTRSAA